MTHVISAQTFMSNSVKWLLMALCFVFIPVFGLPAWAALGGTVGTVQADQQHMKGTLRVSAQAGYTLHEIQDASGTSVREFVSPSGTVFAVAWDGPLTPDLHQLLGTYFNRLQQAAQVKRARRAPLVIHDEDLVIEAGGHMRSFRGRAYLPQLAPAGVDLQSIK